VTEPPPTLGCESCASRDVVLAAQARAVEELTAANARLVERVMALERIVGRNSGNSSMPPSSDDLPGRRKPQPKPVKGLVYLLVYQHVPVGRCAELIGGLTGGVGPSSGFVHSMLARCAAACAPARHADQEVDHLGVGGRVR